MAPGGPALATGTTTGPAGAAVTPGTPGATSVTPQQQASAAAQGNTNWAYNSDGQLVAYNPKGGAVGTPQGAAPTPAAVANTGPSGIQYSSSVSPSGKLTSTPSALIGGEAGSLAGLGVPTGTPAGNLAAGNSPGVTTPAQSAANTSAVQGAQTAAQQRVGAPGTAGTPPSTPAASFSPTGAAPTTPGAMPTGNSALDALLGASGGAPAGSTGAGSVATSALDPNANLTQQVISPGALANPVQQALAASQTASQAAMPQFQAALRQAQQAAAAGGALGSGMLNSALGNVAQNFGQQQNITEQNLLENALNTQNQDVYQNVGIAQEQQANQEGQQQNAFNQSLAEEQAGQQNNPAQTSLILSQLFGNEAGQAGQGLSGLIGNTTMANAYGNMSGNQSALLQAMGLLPASGGGTMPTFNSGFQGGTPGLPAGYLPGMTLPGTAPGNTIVPQV